MGYSAITLSAARTALADRLADTSMVRWVSGELDRILLEALRTWNAYTASYRTRGIFSTTAQTPFYDLGTQLAALCPRTVTNYDVMRTIQDALLEPVSPSAWTGTAQYTLSDLSGAVERRRNQFLKETGSVLTRITPTITPTPAGRSVLQANVLSVRRAAWVSTDGLISTLQRDDEWGANHYLPGWPQAMQRPPSVFSVATTPPLQIQLMPPPQDTGRLDMLVVQQGADVINGTEATLGIQNDWAWVIKFGALADLFGRDGLAYDPQRAGYCEARWQQGLTAAKTAPVVIAGRINDVTARIIAVSDADRYSPLWQTVAGEPKAIITAGHNLLSTWPPPNVVPAGGNFSLTLDVVASMTLPDLDGDDMNLPADAIDPVLDYAQHVALLKEGPGQLRGSQPLLDRFLRYCGVTLNWQQAQQPARRPLVGQQAQDLETNHDSIPAVEVTA